MNIALFYQLRERLCATAVAGCATIGEDFRLQRAVEEFEPLAKTNKVFGRLYAMCVELLANGNPALLADCIALCDALAVTQGTFKDNSETSEFEGIKSCKPSDMSYSALVSLNKEIESRDPRIIKWYLNQLKSNIPNDLKKSVIDFFGRDLVPMLKERVDLTNPKEKGNFVEYVGELAGTDENEWYISLVYNENISDDVRASAVRNLAYSKLNAERLLEIYRTEKAKLKNAAAFALVQLDVPESEIILNKVVSGKFAKKNAEIISVSRNKIAVDFAVDYAEKWVEESENNPKAITFVYDYDLVVQMLANKTDIEDILNKIAEHNGRESISNVQLWEMLVTNLGRHKDEEYCVLIENLYRRSPDYFTMPYLFMIMTEDRGIEITDLPELVDKYRYNLLITLYLIRYDNVRNCYTLQPQFTQYKHYDDKLVKTILVSNSKFEKILEFISDTSYMKTPLVKLKLKSYKYYDYSAQKVKGDVYADQCVYLAYRTFEYLYNNAPLDDKNRILSLAVTFYKESMKYFPRDDVFKSLCIHDVQYIRENSDLLENMIMFKLEHFDEYVREFYFDEVPKDVLDVIIPKIYRNLKKLKSISIKKNVLSQQIHVVERFMIKNGYDKEKILKGNE